MNGGDDREEPGEVGTYLLTDADRAALPSLSPTERCKE